jgi:hypothetical protein
MNLTTLDESKGLNTSNYRVVFAAHKEVEKYMIFEEDNEWEEGEDEEWEEEEW